MGRDLGGWFRMGNTCTPMADSCQCMLKQLQYCKVISLQLKDFFLILLYLTFKKLKNKSNSCFPGDSVVKNLPANAGDLGSTPGSGRSPGEEIGNPLQYSSLGNPIDREAWWATVHGVTKELNTTE